MPSRDLDVLFINPPFNRFLDRVRMFGIPYGMLQLATVLESEGMKARVFDAELDDTKGSKYADGLKHEKVFYKLKPADDHPVWSEIESAIEKSSPKIVGIGINTCQYGFARKVARIAKNVDDRIRVVAGGAHPNVLAEDTASRGDFDYVVFGEGERTMPELSRALLEGREPTGVAGVCYRKGRKVLKNKRRPLIGDLDSIPFPDRDLLLGVRRYSRYKLGLIVSSRGCVGRCTFCYNRLMWGESIRFRSAENVVDEIEHVHRKYGTYDFNIADDTFNADPKRAERICDEIAGRGIDVSWTCSCRADRISKALAEKMSRAGCFEVKVGVESGSQDVLDDMKKGTTLEQVRKAAAMVRVHGMDFYAWFMLGNFNDTDDTIAESEKLVDYIRPDVIDFSILVPYPGTEVRRRAEAEGRLIDADWLEYNGRTPLVRIDGLTGQALLKYYERFRRMCNESEARAVRKRLTRLPYLRRKILENIRSPQELAEMARQAVEVCLNSALKGV